MSGQDARIVRRPLHVRVRAWWQTTTYLGDVALGFAVVTVANSVMMITGLDEPKTGTFAYVHLLSRLAIIAAVVAVFHLDDARAWLARRRARQEPGRHRRSLASVGRGALDWLLAGWLEGTARVYTVAVVLVCLAVLALAEVHPPQAGHALYRNLVVLAVVLLPLMVLSHRWRQRRATRGPGVRR